MRRTEIKPLPFLHQAIPSGLSFQRLSIRHLSSAREGETILYRAIRYQSFPLIVASLAPLVSPFGRLRQAPPRGLPRRWSAFQLSALSFCPRLRLSLSVFRSQPSACSFQPFSLLLPPSPRLIRFANPYGLPLAFYLPTVGCVALRAAFDRVDARLWSSTLRAPAGAVSISKRFALSGYPRGLPRRWSAFQPLAWARLRLRLRLSVSAFPLRSAIFHLPSAIFHLPSIIRYSLFSIRYLVSVHRSTPASPPRGPKREVRRDTPPPRGANHQRPARPTPEPLPASTPARLKQGSTRQSPQCLRRPRDEEPALFQCDR